jgi:hypothetical protein
MLCFAMQSPGQVNGHAHGLIHDAAGSPVAGAQVVARNSGESSDRRAVSAADGSFKMDDLKPGRYQFKATKTGWADSPVAEEDLTAGQDVALSLTLGADPGFLKRLAQAYAKDWQGSAASGPPRL